MDNELKHFCDRFNIKIEESTYGKFCNVDTLFKYRNYHGQKIGEVVKLKLSEKEKILFIQKHNIEKLFSKICASAYPGHTIAQVIHLFKFDIVKKEDYKLFIRFLGSTKDKEIILEVDAWEVANKSDLLTSGLEIDSIRERILTILELNGIKAVITNEKGKLKDVSKYYYDFINNKLYAKDKYVRLSGKYYLLSSNLIAIDIFTNKYGLKRNMKCVLSIDKDTNKMITSYTSNDINKLIPIILCRKDYNSFINILPEPQLLRDTHYIYCENKLIAEKLGFVEDYIHGVFRTSSTDLNNYLPRPNYKAYNATKKKSQFSNKMEASKFGVDSFTNLITQNKYYSYGVELETSSGYVPPYVMNDLNLRCVRDGSIQGGEYVTGILVGDSGLEHIKDITVELSKRCKVDKTCGLHLHIGGTNFNKEFIVLSYILGLKLENDIHSILPKSRFNNHYCQQLDGNAIKNYKSLSKGIRTIEDYKLFIDSSYEKLYNYYLSNNGFLGKDYNKKNDHPGRRWNTTRYFWLNLQPCMFATPDSEGLPRIIDEVHSVKFGTTVKRINPDYCNIEFRNHSGTLSFTKIKNWILICSAFVYYVENNKKAILKNASISLEDIIKFSYKDKPHYKLQSSLLNYVNKRREKFFGISDEDYNNDNKDLKEIPVNIKEMMSKIDGSDVVIPSPVFTNLKCSF